MNILIPGKLGEPLPRGETVLRLARKPKDFDSTHKVSPEAFELSSEDKTLSPPRLSVWAKALTTRSQAWELAGGKSEYELVLELPVGDVRELRPEPESSDVMSLDIVWDPLLVVVFGCEQVPSSKAGAEGHAGIVGLSRPEGLARKYYKSLRKQLADLAVARELPGA